MNSRYRNLFQKEQMPAFPSLYSEDDKGASNQNANRGFPMTILPDNQENNEGSLVTPLQNPEENSVIRNERNGFATAPVLNSGENNQEETGNGMSGFPITPMLPPGSINNGNSMEGFPVTPLPNPGEGGPVGNGNGMGNIPVTLLPNPGEGGPVGNGNGMDGFPVTLLPNPGEGGSVSGGNMLPPIIGTIITTYPKPNQPCNFCTLPGQNSGNVRMLNASSGYNPFRIYINAKLLTDELDHAELTGYERIPSGYQMFTVMGENSYIYIQKPVYVPRNEAITVAICNTETGLDLFTISDTPCNLSSYVSCVRACNLSYNSGPLNVVIGSNEVVFSNVSFQDVTSYRIIRPNEYVYYVVNGNGTALVSSIINIQRNVSYTIYMFNWNPSSPDAIRLLVVEEH